MAYKGNLRYIIKHLLHVVDPSLRGLSLAFVIIVLSALFFSFIAHGTELLLHHLIKNEYLYALSLISLSLLIYIFLSLIYVYQSKKYEKLDYEINEVKLKPFKVLILFVSTPNRDTELHFESLKDPAQREILIRDKNNRANWIIPLVLLDSLSRIGKIEKLCLIFSEESYPHRNKFLELIYSSIEKVELIEKKVNFFNWKKLQEALVDLLRELTNTYREEEILLDVTSGTVPASIVGASLTYRRNITISYVNTKDRSIHVLNIFPVVKEI